MRKFLRVCHVISRILIVLSVAAILVLYYLRPDGLAFLGIGGATAENFWQVFATTLAMASVMFAASDWAFTSMEEKNFLVNLSSAVLRPCYDEHDLSDRRYAKAAAADEMDFNANLREVTDGKERVLQELAWERKNNKRLKGKATGNGIISLIFFVAALFFLIYPFVVFILQGQLLALPDGSFMPYFTLAAVILTLLILCDNTGYQILRRRLNTILSIRNRNDGLEDAVAAPVLPAPAPVPVPPPAPVSVAAPAAPVVTAPAPTPTPAAESPVPTEPEPVFTPADPVPAEPETTDSIFESLEPEEDSPEF